MNLHPKFKINEDAFSCGATTQIQIVLEALVKDK